MISHVQSQNSHGLPPTPLLPSPSSSSSPALVTKAHWVKGEKCIKCACAYMRDCIHEAFILLGAEQRLQTSTFQSHGENGGGASNSLMGYSANIREIRLNLVEFSL